jgi:aspartate/methionine/tyrosine aminotransferase
MNFLAEQLNETLGPVADLLSPAGKRLYFPYGGILGQGAEAKSCAINATIGMAFEEDGTPLVMDSFAKLTNLPRTSFLYAGSFGLPKLRETWALMQKEKNPSMKGKKVSSPVVTNALTHGIRIIGELFVNEGDEVIVPDLYWDNYSLVFEESCGGVIKTYETFKNGAFNALALRELILSEGEKKIVILNFPNNPTGYTCTEADAVEIIAAVKAGAQNGKKIVVVLDDAYFGLVYEDGVHGESLFSDFADIHENVLAVKLDGTTKEDYVWGLRVGFLTFAFKGATDEQLKALEAKAAGNVRSAISNVTALGQHMAVKAFADPEYAAQKQMKYNVLKARYMRIREILASHPEYAESFEPMPFNSGYFMCVKPVDVDAEKVRKHLVEKYSTGTIVLSGLLRLAFSTVSIDTLDKLFANVDAAIREVRSLS